MAQRWKRPDSVPFPSVWLRFEGKKKINGISPKFWVQDIPEDLYETAVKMMCENFLRDEPLSRFSNVLAKPRAVEIYRNLLRTALQGRLGLVCFMENPDQKDNPIIAGLNITYVDRKGDRLDKGKEGENETPGKIRATIELGYGVDPFEKLGVTEILNSLGLLVLPEFRGQSLGLEILKAREPLCRAVGLTATTTLFTSTASQKLAKKCGFEVAHEITYEEVEKINPRLRFPGISEYSKGMKHMYMLFN